TKRRRHQGNRIVYSSHEGTTDGNDVRGHGTRPEEAAGRARRGTVPAWFPRRATRREGGAVRLCRVRLSRACGQCAWRRGRAVALRTDDPLGAAVAVRQGGRRAMPAEVGGEPRARHSGLPRLSDGGAEGQRSRSAGDAPDG